MSDNDDNDVDDTVADDATLYKFEGEQFGTDIPRERVRLTRAEEELKLEELIRIQQWAEASRRSLLASELSLHDDPGRFFLWKRIQGKTSMKVDILNLYSAGVSLIVNGWAFEQFGVVLICLTSTLAYSLAPKPSSQHLGSQLDFHVRHQTAHMARLRRTNVR
jgi:hypothetical protein